VEENKVDLFGEIKVGLSKGKGDWEVGEMGGGCQLYGMDGN